ncbi:MAG TPA: hypothetical protein VFL93_16015 [Longimicrobiaceae bacterium]|nr:hypothetical protein [Longimicrobiaceae bacterium]
MPNPSQHLSEWTIEQFAEGALPAAEQESAAAHLAGCAHCAAELEAYRALAHALSSLPRFEPSPSFADAVMARVRVTPPEPRPLAERLAEWLPSTTRGWLLAVGALAAPVLSLIAAVAFILWRPVASDDGLGRVILLRGHSTLRVWAEEALHRAVTSGLASHVASLYQSVIDVPAHSLVIALVVLAITVPISGWALVRLVRTPMGKRTYAN